nr:zinc finger, CCHC-type, retrotransposon Gag domain protein [Tanacetum cinerariifolium]
MVNTRTDAELAAAVRNALQTLLPQIRAEIREEFRTGSGPSGSGGNPPSVTIHTWLKRFNKQKPCLFKKATALVDAENWISYMEKIFDVMAIMSSDSHATVTYTSMSSYEVIINGYYGMPLDPLDPYVQLFMGAPPSPDYIPGPEAPPLPNYIPRPEAPPSPDYIPRSEYPEYLPPADDMLPAEEQPMPATDDADNEDEEESSDSEEEEEEHLALTVPAPALYSSVSKSNETEPLEEGETAATPPPFGYLMSLDSHATVTYTSMSSYEVTINEYY